MDSSILRIIEITEKDLIKLEELDLGYLSIYALCICFVPNNKGERALLKLKEAKLVLNLLARPKIFTHRSIH